MTSEIPARRKLFRGRLCDDVMIVRNYGKLRRSYEHQPRTKTGKPFTLTLT